jgi:hypothetical protein
MRQTLLAVVALAAALPVLASTDVGVVKVSQGPVQIERDGKSVPASVGMAVRASDTLRTGANGSAGVTFADNSLVSVGPNTVFSIDKYRFDSTTHAGEFEGSLKKGKLAAVSGKMVKQTPESMKIRTPSSVMAVRGTEFVVSVDEPVAAAR